MQVWWVYARTGQPTITISPYVTPPALLWSWDIDWRSLCNDVGGKRYFAPSDTELLRALHSRNSKNIRNSLIFLQKMATYSCFLRVPSSKILLQASLCRILDLLTLVSYHLFKKSVSSDTIPHFRGQTGKRLRLRNRILHSNGSVCPCR